MGDFKNIFRASKYVVYHRYISLSLVMYAHPYSGSPNTMQSSMHSSIYRPHTNINTPLYHPAQYPPNQLRGMKRRREQDFGLDDLDRDWMDEVYCPMIYSKGSEIHFTAEVCDETINKLIREFQKVIRASSGDAPVPVYLDKEEDAPVVTLFICSYGGNLDATFRWMDYISLLKQTGKIKALITVLTGFSASAATVMAQMGDVRMMTSNAFAMIHELLSSYSGSFSKLKSEIQFCEKLEKKIIDLFVQRTKLDEETIVNFLLRDTWFSAEEYLTNGFIDDIFDFDRMKKEEEEADANGEEEKEANADANEEKEEEKEEEDESEPIVPPQTPPPHRITRSMTLNIPATPSRKKPRRH